MKVTKTTIIFTAGRTALWGKIYLNGENGETVFFKTKIEGINDSFFPKEIAGDFVGFNKTRFEKIRSENANLFQF